MIIETSISCKFCREEIKTKGTFYNQLCIDDINRIKWFTHIMKSHNPEIKWVFKSMPIVFFLVAKIIFKAVLQIVIWTLIMLTTPFWALHEFLQ